jgi:hypothetical protein
MQRLGIIAYHLQHYDVLLIRLYQIYRASILRSPTISSKTLVLEKSCTLFISEDTKEFCPPYRESKFSVDTTSCVDFS